MGARGIPSPADETATRCFLENGFFDVGFHVVNTSGRSEDERLRPVIAIDRYHNPISLNGEDRHRLLANPNDITRLENQLGIHAESASGTNDLDHPCRPREADVSGDYTPLLERNSIRFGRKRESV